MFDIITKTEYLDWYRDEIADRSTHSLKGIQDAWVLSLFVGKKGLRMAEAGGGNSRVLRNLRNEHECWNIDKFEGMGGGPKNINPNSEKGINVVKSYLGEYSKELPSNYFDVLFSISVIEHIEKNMLNSFFDNSYRILKPGGMIAHAIDIHLYDDPQKNGRDVKRYCSAVQNSAFEWLLPPKINQDIRFKCHYASNSDATMGARNLILPGLRKMREFGQNVSIKMIAIKR
jgi:hypothetical protein